MRHLVVALILLASPVYGQEKPVDWQKVLGDDQKLKQTVADYHAAMVALTKQYEEDQTLITNSVVNALMERSRNATKDGDLDLAVMMRDAAHALEKGNIPPAPPGVVKAKPKKKSRAPVNAIKFGTSNWTAPLRCCFWP